MAETIVSPAVRLNKSSLFVQFNRARSKSAGLDRKRVNRALGYIQAGRVALLDDGAAVVSGESEPVYWVTSEGCDCADATFRGTKCKHIVARWLLLRMEQAAPVVATPDPENVSPGTHLPESELLNKVQLEDAIASLWGA